MRSLALKVHTEKYRKAGMRKHLLFLCAGLIVFCGAVMAKQFEVFDGQFYNGLYYPRIDMIEWSDEGRPPHMEFHIYSKEKKLDLAAVPGDKNGKPVLWLMIDLKFRGERVCRHVLAPSHFREGDKIYAYRDDSFPEYDNIFVSTYPMQGKRLVPYAMPEYQPCVDEMASNKPGTGGAARVPASAIPAAEKKDGKNIGVDYDNSAVPFSF